MEADAVPVRLTAGHPAIVNVITYDPNGTVEHNAGIHFYFPEFS